MVKNRQVVKKKPKILQATNFHSQYAHTPSIFYHISLRIHRNTRWICFVLLGSDLFVKVRAVAGKSRNDYSHTMLPIVHTRSYVAYKTVCRLCCTVTDRGLQYLISWSSIVTRSGHSRVPVRRCEINTVLLRNSKAKDRKESQRYHNPVPCVN